MMKNEWLEIIACSLSRSPFLISYRKHHTLSFFFILEVTKIR